MLVKTLKLIGYWFLSWTWGILITFCGACGALFFLIKGKKPKKYKGAFYFEVGGPNWGGVNLGPFFFVDTKTNLDIVSHEWGHSIQNIIMGPVHVIFSIVSFSRYHYRDWITSNKCPEKWRKKYTDLPDYDDFWFEGWATKIGEKYYKEGDYQC
jgi:hypothetical protein